MSLLLLFNQPELIEAVFTIMDVVFAAKKAGTTFAQKKAGITFTAKDPDIAFTKVE